MKSIELPVSEARREFRTNIFIMATLYSTTGSSPVKIRDLSSRGALVEGGVLPHSGAKVTLCRGRLSITGEVAWRRDARAGLKFESGACVAHWLPSGRAFTPQDKVDSIFRRVELPLNSFSASGEISPAQGVRHEIARVKKLVEALAEDLAGDMNAIQRHGPKLQVLDLAAQILGKLGSNYA